MRDVVDTLETQHRALEVEVATLQQALATEDLTVAQTTLEHLQTMIAAHLQLEHSDFYPRFLKLAEADAPTTAQTVRLFEENLRRIGEGVLGFLDRWKGTLDRSRLDALKTEWASALRLLAGRLRDEERTLHPIWRRLSANGSRGSA